MFVQFAYDILHVECNSATDNPMIFPDIRRIDSFAHVYESELKEARNMEKGIIISGGNFHGEVRKKFIQTVLYPAFHIPFACLTSLFKSFNSLIRFVCHSVLSMCLL